jgi:hypothetical protein
MMCAAEFMRGALESVWLKGGRTFLELTKRPRQGFNA